MSSLSSIHAEAPVSIRTDKLFDDPDRLMRFTAWLESNPRLDMIFMPGAKSYTFRIVGEYDPSARQTIAPAYRNSSSFLGVLWLLFEEAEAEADVPPAASAR